MVERVSLCPGDSEQQQKKKQSYQATYYIDIASEEHLSYILSIEGIVG